MFSIVTFCAFDTVFAFIFKVIVSFGCKFTTVSTLLFESIPVVTSNSPTEYVAFINSSSSGKTSSIFTLFAIISDIFVALIVYCKTSPLVRYLLLLSHIYSVCIFGFAIVFLTGVTTYSLILSPVILLNVSISLLYSSSRNFEVFNSSLM